MADRNVWSVEDLRAFKRNAGTIEEVRGKFEWTNPRVLVRLGGNYDSVGRPLIAFGNKPLVTLDANDMGLLEVSFDLYSKDGQRLVARMEKNAFRASPEGLHDLHVDPSATKLKIKATKYDALIDVWYKVLSREQLLQQLQKDRSESGPVPPGASDPVGESVMAWATLNATRPDGTISMLDFRNLRLHSPTGLVEVRNGVTTSGGFSMKYCARLD